ncbi:MAG TPA: hypothetical protein PKE00_05070 [Planctomycetota bacterium]|nr:hypothetical protein [Planctomycetota bacterium]
MERITTVRLAEALSQASAVANEKITEALYQQDSTGVPFPELLIDGGEISEWDLAKLVVQHFQLPFLMASNCQIDRNAVACLPEDFLFEHRMLPLQVTGIALTVSMPVLVTHKVLQEAQQLSGKNLFPIVGLGSENLRFLFELFPDHPRDNDDRRRKQAAKRSTQSSDSWESIFDVGDQEVLKDLGL